MIFGISILTYISTLIALATLIVTIVVSLKQRHRKEIAYEVISNTPVVPDLEEINSQNKGILHVYYNNKPVRGAHMIILKIWNAGTDHIVPTDKDELIIFNFGEKAEVLSVGILGTSRGIVYDNVDKALKIDPNDASKVLLGPVLLNLHSTIMLKVMLLQFSGKINTDETSIFGLDRISEYNTAKRSSRRLRRALMLITIAIFIFNALSFILSSTQFKLVQSNLMLTIGMGLSMIALALIVMLFFFAMRLQNRIVVNASDIIR